MSKKNENKELNAILAQLKKSYSDEEDVDQAQSEESQDDFQKMLSSYFSDNDSDKDIYKFTVSETSESESQESEYAFADLSDFEVIDEPVVEETIEEIVEDEPVVEETIEEIVEDEPIVEETIEEIVEDGPLVEETIEEIVEDELNDADIVDDVFAVMFPATPTEHDKSEIEPYVDEVYADENPLAELDEMESDEFAIEQESEFQDDYAFSADDVINPVPEDYFEAEGEIPESTEIDSFIDLPTDDVIEDAQFKETIDDIIGALVYDDSDVVLDTDAVIPTVDDEDEDEKLIFKEEIPSDDEQIYLNDPLQGHLSDAAFVSTR